MILTDLPDFLAALAPGRAICGLDLGDKTIGVAVSDLSRSIATPIEVIRREKFTLDAQRLLAIVANRNAAGLILGLPLNMDGSEGPRVQSTRAFARNLEKLTPLPISFWDERLSTVAAEREGNIHAHDGITEDEFVQMREARDATLDMPRLILPSIQVNMRGGHMPEPEDNGTSYLKLPVNTL